MGRWLKAPATKLDNLISKLGTYMGEQENQLLQVDL